MSTPRYNRSLAYSQEHVASRPTASSSAPSLPNPTLFLALSRPWTPDTRIAVQVGSRTRRTKIKRRAPHATIDATFLSRNSGCFPKSSATESCMRENVPFFWKPTCSRIRISVGGPDRGAPHEPGRPPRLARPRRASRMFDEELRMEGSGAVGARVLIRSRVFPNGGRRVI